MSRPTSPFHLLRVLAAALVVCLGVGSCGTDHGQAKALTACRTFASANGGGLSAPARTAKLSTATDWAARASKQSGQWDLLHSSLAQFVTASTQAAPSTTTVAALSNARKVIDGACEIAARGY